MSLIINANKLINKHIYLICKTKSTAKCPHAGLNYRPSVYKTDALPLSYRGKCDASVEPTLMKAFSLQNV